jgi:hypothetical protein
LNPKFVEKTARQTGFVKIDSPLNGLKFLELLLKNSENDKNLSLNQLSLSVLGKSGFSISKQAIDGRFSEKSVLFIKNIFESYLKSSSTSMISEEDSGWMSMFNRVLVKDGTRFDLPKDFSSHFKGFGGSCSSDSAMCIQFEYDLKTGEIVDLRPTSANIPDSKDAQETKGNILPGDLIIRDLGYFGLNIFNDMVANDSYFISKLNTQVVVYEFINEQYQEIDFKKLYQQMKETNCFIKELDVYIGKVKKIPTRLIIELVPQEVYEQRIRQKNKNAKKSGYQMRDSFKAQQNFNIFISNIEKEKLPAKSIRNIYRLRWQIELVFKQWKSTYKIDKTHKMKYERWMTLFYARMLLMLIHWRIYHAAKTERLQIDNKLLSIAKCLNTLKLKAKEITELIKVKTMKFGVIIRDLLEMILTKHDIENKKGRKSQKEIIDILYCI